MSFEADISAFIAKAKGNVDEVVGAVTSSIVRGIDAASPVGDPKLWKSPPPKGYVGGRFRANNWLGVDAVPTGTTQTVDPTGTRTVTMNIGRIPEQAAGHVFWIANNLPYARRLEYDHWSSQTGGAGIYGRVALNFQNIAREEAAKVNT